MADLITRQAAIDVLDRNRILGQGLLNDTLDHIADVIMALPSAQPETHEERTETHACDLISRQAAIDALTRKMVSIPTAGEKDLMGDVNRIRAEDISVIKRLPSAQPEIIRCKDCKYGDTFHEFDDPEMPMKCIGHHYGGTYPDDFCSYAERRTDCNGRD